MGNTKGSTTLKWKGEITFEGTIEQFQSFKAGFEKQPVKISVPELERKTITRIPYAGYIPAKIEDIFAAEQLEKIAEGAVRMNFSTIEGIAGGIRTPHVHLGDEVALIDKERFKSILGEVARGMVEQRINLEDDYCDMVRTLVNG